MRIYILTLLSGLFIVTQALWAAENSGGTEFQGLDKRIQSLKQEVVDLNSDLLLLEEELLFPASTQLSVFFSLDVGEYLSPDSLQVKVDGKVVANHLYTQREINALKRGGVQRIYLGNLKMGQHSLVAYVIGKDWRGRDTKLATKTKFKKGDVPKYIELQVIDVKTSRQANFEAKIWE